MGVALRLIAELARGRVPFSDRAASGRSGAMLLASGTICVMQLPRDQSR